MATNVAFFYMQKYFLNIDEFNNKIIKTHSYQIAKVMRMKKDDEILVSYLGKTYLVRLEKVDINEVSFTIVKEEMENSELPVVVDIAQGYAKSDKMDFIVQKAVELGANGIYPIIMKRSIVQLDKSKQITKRERLEKIALEAARQSHREIVPQVYDVFSLDKIDYQAYDYIIVAYEEQAKNDEKSAFKNILSNLKGNERILLIVGPEGGIDGKEIDFLLKNKAVLVGLGPRILRTETAALYMLCALSYEMELGK